MMLILGGEKKVQNEWQESEYLFLHTSVFKIYNGGTSHPRKPDYRVFSNCDFKNISALSALSC